MSLSFWSDEDWNDFLDDDVAERTYSYFIEQCLDDPLVDSKLLRYALALGDTTKANLLRSDINVDMEKDIIRDIRAKYPRRTLEFVPYTPVKMIEMVGEFILMGERTCRVPPKEVCTQLGAVLSQASSNVTPTANPAPSAFSASTVKYYGGHWEARRILDVLRSRYAFDGGHGGWAKVRHGDVYLTNNDFVWIHGSTATYGSFAMFLCVQDILRLRYTAHLCRDIIDKPGLTEEVLNEQMDWQFRVLRQYGNEGYDLVKAPESLWKTYVSRIAGGSFDAADSYDDMCAKQRVKERKLNRLGESPMIDQFIAFQETQDSVEVCVELFGIVKAAGFPVVDPSFGCDSARTYAQAPDTSTLVAVADSWRTFCHLFLVNYIRANGAWPPLEFRKQGTQLEQLRDDNRLFITDGSYPLTDWDHTGFKKVFDFEYFEDYLELMEDKSCAPPRGLVERFYRRDKNVDKSMRRILKVMLESPVVDTKKLIKEFAGNALSPEEFVIFLRPKEKEFKLAARMYCMMTFSIRLIFSIIQENVKREVFKYFPYQSMTMDASELTQKLLSMTAGSVAEETLFIEVDLTRWNLCFRHRLIRGYGTRLDALFGTSNVFGRANEFFSQCDIISFSTDRRIDQLEEGVWRDSSTGWRNHQGGFEGIDQATMTLATLVMIYRALRTEKCSFVLLGQGDNQTLAITRYDKSEPMSVFANRVMGKIDKSCTELNHVSKPEECVLSTKVLTYSKVFVVAGRIIPMELKYAMGVAPITSTDVPAIGDAIGAIFSAAAGSAQNAVDPLKHWALANVVYEDTIDRFLNNGAWFGQDRLDSSGIPRMGPILKKMGAIVPSILGGFPISGWQAFVARNDPDPLTSAIACLRFLAPYDRHIQQYITYILSDAAYRKLPDLASLIKDPYSIPLKSPPSQQSKLSEAAATTLRQCCRNEEIWELLVKKDMHEPALIRALTSMRPLYPALMHDLWKISLPGCVASIEKKFTLTRSITGPTRASPGPLNSRLLDAEMRHCHSIVARFWDAAHTSPAVPPRTVLSIEIARSLRAKWGIKYPDLEGLETTHPLDYVITTDPAVTRGVISVFYGDYRAGGSTRGPLRPFLGGKTKERRIGKLYEVKKAPNVLELQKLVSISTAGGVGPGFRELIRSVLQSRSSVPLETLEHVFPKVVGGILAHRYEMLGTRGNMAPVGNPNLQTYLVFNTDTVPGISDTLADYPVAFQQFFSYLTFFQRRVMLENPGSESRLVAIGLTSEGLQPLVQEEIAAATNWTPPNTENLRHNRLAWVNHLSVKSRIADFDIQFAAPIEIGQLTKSTGGLMTLLVSALIECVGSRGPTAVRLDDEHLQGEEFPGVGAKEFDAIGSERMTEASCLAVAILSIVSLVGERHRGDETREHNIVGLCEKWADIVLDSWIANTWRSNASVSWLVQQGLLMTGAGQRTDMGWRRPLHRFIVSKAEKIVATPSDMRVVIPLVAIGRTPSKAIGSVMNALAAAILWRCYQLGAKPSVLRHGKRIFQASRQLGDSELPRDLYTRVLIEEVMDKIGDRHAGVAQPLLLSRLERVNSAPYKLVDLSLIEVWRYMRQLPKQEGPRPPRVSLPFDYIKPSLYDHSALKFVKTRDQHTQLPEPSPYRGAGTTSEIISQRRSKSGGVWSTAGSTWQPVLDRIRKNARVLVIGTGNGGIQAYLAAMGVATMGVDLQSVVNPRLVGTGIYYPAELSIFRASNASMLPGTGSSVEDLLAPGNLGNLIYKYGMDEVIIDVEGGPEMDARSIVSSVVDNPYKGTFHFKLMLSRDEHNAVVSVLQEGSRLSLVSVVNGYIGPNPTDDKQVPRIYTVKTQPGCSASQEVLSRWIVETPERTSWPSGSEEVRSRMVDAMTGGFVKGVEGGVEEKMEHLQQLITHARSDARGRFSSENYVAMVISYAALELTIDPTISNAELQRVVDEGYTVQWPGFRFRISPNKHTSWSRTVLGWVVRLV